MSWNTSLQISKAVENPYNRDLHLLQDLTVDGNANIGGSISVHLPLNDVLADGNDADGQDITNVGTIGADTINLTNEINCEGVGISVKNTTTNDILLLSPDESRGYAINANVDNSSDFGLTFSGKNAGGTFDTIFRIGSDQYGAVGKNIYLQTGSTIKNVPTPTTGDEVASKDYVDSSIPSAPTLSAVLTAGNDGGSLNMYNIGNILNNGDITFLGGNGTPSYTYQASFGANTLGIQSRLVCNTDGAGKTMVAGNNIELQTGNNVNVSSSSAGNIFTMGEWYFNRGSPTYNSYFVSPQIKITRVNDSATDSSTSTAMSSYNISGADKNQIGATGRNWMINKVYSGGAEIARMRIALDKGYFATEQHPVRIPSHYDNSYYGLILSSKSEYINDPTVSEAHIYCEVSTTEKDKSCYGIYSNYDFPVMTGQTAEEQIYSLYIPQNTPESKIGYSNSGGEGQIWVCNINGNIEKGDYICSSSICGIGMKQDDDLKHNYTMFKSAFDCDFTNQTSTYPKHIVDSKGEREWRNPEDHSEGFKYEMVSYTNVSHILDIYEDKYTIKKVNKIILTFPYDFKTNKPELVGKRFRVMLIGGTYQN